MRPDMLSQVGNVVTLDHDVGYWSGDGHFPVDAIQGETEPRGNKMTGWVSQPIHGKNRVKKILLGLEQLDWKGKAVIFKKKKTTLH